MNDDEMVVNEIFETIKNEPEKFGRRQYFEKCVELVQIHPYVNEKFIKKRIDRLSKKLAKRWEEYEGLIARL